MSDAMRQMSEFMMRMGGAVNAMQPANAVPDVNALHANIDALKLENARLRDRVSDLEAACRTARRALRRVRLLATRLPEDRRDMPRSCERLVG